MTMMMTAIMMRIMTITVTMVIILVVTQMMIGTTTMHSYSNHKNEVISVKNQMIIQTIPGKAFLHFRVTLDPYQKVKKLLVDH